MAEFVHNDVSKAIRNVLRGDYAFTDETRATAVEEVRHLAGDRIYRGRRARSGDVSPSDPYVIITKPIVVRTYFVGGECDQAETSLQLLMHAEDPAICDRLADAIRQALTSMVITVDLGNTNMRIAGCTLDDDGDFEPDAPVDNSEDYVFLYQQLWRINHDNVVPAGVD